MTPIDFFGERSAKMQARWMCTNKIWWRKLLNKVMRAGPADRAVKCSNTKPPQVWRICSTLSFILYFLQWLQTRYFPRSHRGSKQHCVVGCRGIWWVVKRPGIFFFFFWVNHQQRGNFSESNSQPQGRTSLESLLWKKKIEKILRHFSLARLCCYRHSYTLLHMLYPSPLPSFPQIHVCTHPSLLFLILPSFPSRCFSKPPPRGGWRVPGGE